MEILTITKELAELFSKYDLCRIQANQIKGLGEKLEKKEITVAVIGQFKRGKSTLVNNILGKELLPVGIVPITAAVTRIRYGRERGMVTFENGLKEQVEIRALPEYISEQKNSDNRLKVSEVEVCTEADFLKDGLILVDTPGVGSVHEKNSQLAYDFAKESDAVIFMLSVDSPVNKIETEFLESAKRYAGKFYFSVNKTDIIDEGELREYLAYCKGLISGLMGSGEVKLFPLSAKTGQGVRELQEAVTADLAKTADDIMERSVRLKLLEILKNTGTQIGSYRNVLKMAPNVFHSRFREMNRLLEERKEANGRTAEGQKRIPVTVLNEERQYLAYKVKELFEIEYYCEIEELEEDRAVTAEEYKEKADALYSGLEETLNTIFMYKEENAYTVARRIEDLNILIRKIEKYKKIL